VAIHVGKPHGIVAYGSERILGMKSGRRSILKNVESTFFNGTHQAAIFYLYHTKYFIRTRKSMQKYTL